MLASRTRREFLRTTASLGGLLGLGNLSFLSRLPAVGAAEANVSRLAVRLRPEIEPLVRLLEETPREKLLEEVASRIRGGLSYREVLSALLLAGVRNVQPRPSVGFKFHAVLVVNSAHLASLSSPDRDRWLPIFWALDHFKGSQARDVEEGDWTMPPVDEARLPSATKARQAFVDAMERWDEAAADVAVASLARSAGANEVFELFFRFGARDFRSIGHKAIYVANSMRTLGCIGWEHAEPVLRSLAYALLAREGSNPPSGDAPADRPWRRNLELARQIRADWKEVKKEKQDQESNRACTNELLQVLRLGGDEDASKQVVALLNDGASVQSLWDALMMGAAELLVRRPGILALHAVTSTNALYQAFLRTASDETGRLLLLQNAAFLPLFRKAMEARGQPPSDARLETLAPDGALAGGPPALEEIFATVSADRMTAARKTAAYLSAKGSAEEFINAARLLVFLKGNDSHDYKFSSAVLEDYYHLSPARRALYLAASVFQLRGSTDGDNPLVQRIRNALGSRVF